MFEEIFSRFYEKNREIKVIGVWGKDGLELEKKYFSDIRDINRYIDLDFSGAELADIINKLDKTKAATGTFFMKLNYRNYALMIYSLTSDYFLIILSGEEIIEGKLRFYLEMFKEKMIAAF